MDAGCSPGRAVPQPWAPQPAVDHDGNQADDACPFWFVRRRCASATLRDFCINFCFFTIMENRYACKRILINTKACVIPVEPKQDAKTFLGT
jgi:hypothetical protein